MYQIKRCKECGKEVHVHKVNKHYRIKNIECDHIPSEKREHATSSDVDKYLTNEIPRKKQQHDAKKQHMPRHNNRRQNKRRR
mgnify:CR=1 FL=1